MNLSRTSKSAGSVESAGTGRSSLILSSRPILPMYSEAWSSRRIIGHTCRRSTTISVVRLPSVSHQDQTEGAAEAQRLRDLLRDRDNEIHNLEESLQEHEADEAKVRCQLANPFTADRQYTREIQTLEAEIKRIESDLLIARKAESVLETQKQENLQLKETIDRMRFDLDEARAAASSANKGSHGRSSTNISSAAGTMSRNLGDEINRRLLKAEVVDEEPPESEDGDSIVETIVTTQRRRVSTGKQDR